MSNFKPFGKAVNARYMVLAKHELFTSDGDHLNIWDAYLKAFPLGTDPLYKVNTEHTCSCCRNFIRNLGSVVAIIDGKIETVWGGLTGLEYPYDVVAKAMDEFVKVQPIASLFRSKENRYGAERTLQDLGEGKVQAWNHFYGDTQPMHRTLTPEAAIGTFNTNAGVFERGLKELNAALLQQVITMATNKDIYRGEEHLPALHGFQALKNAYDALPTDAAKKLYVWANAGKKHALFRNTVIGTLVQDLSEGVEDDKAFRSFEAKVAPANYKRPTALITPAMVTAAMATITELGLEEAMQRRFAKLSDITVNNVLWVASNAKAKMKGGIEDLLMGSVVVNQPKPGQALPMTAEKFMAEVLPTATAMELFLTGLHLPNFVSLTAPVHPMPSSLFRWSNEFAWSYDGNLADSIKEKVGKAGGNITNAALRVSLAWSNYDDLDLHVYEPSGNQIYFVSKRSGSSGFLDVDMNAGGARSRSPVENISWTKVPDGVYKVFVNQYNRRETIDVGFTIEIESGGKLVQMSHVRAASGMTPVVNLKVVGGAVVETQIANGIIGGGVEQDKWGVKTENYVKVQTLMFSPNYWDENAVGNRHYIFALEGCRNPSGTRGIYNEFLNPALEKHRKVFEVLGNKTLCPFAEEQISGVGFSSTRSDTVLVRATSAKAVKTYEITF